MMPNTFTLKVTKFRFLVKNRLTRVVRKSMGAGGGGGVIYMVINTVKDNIIHDG